MSTPNFASKYLLEYSLERSGRDLQELHTFALLKPQKFSKRFSIVCYFKNKFSNSYISANLCHNIGISMLNFDEILSEFREHSTFSENGEH